LPFEDTDSENSYWSLEMGDDNIGDEDESEVSPKKGKLIKKRGSTKTLTLGSDTEDDSPDEEEEIEDIPKKRGRPKGSQNKDRKGKLIKTRTNPKPKWATSASPPEQHQNYYTPEEENPININPRAGRKYSDEVKIEKGEEGKGSSKRIKKLYESPKWATFASPPEQHRSYYTSEEENLIEINPMTGRKYSAEVKIEKGEEGKSSSKSIKKESPSSHSMQDKLAIMKRQFEKAPPQNVKQHFETLWIYILQDPLSTSPYFLAVVALLNNRTKQPSSYLRSSFLSGALQGLAAADTTTPAVERRRGCLSRCEMVTLRKSEFGENEASSHEYIGTIYNHTAVKFMVKFDPKDNNAVPEFINDFLEILKSEMFFASIHQITLLGAASGPSILDMRNSESPVWQYLRNPKNMMVASLTNLNQILLDDEIVKVLKKMYNRQWQDYLYVGWNKCVTGFTNHEYPIFRKK
jgi:hypothetical protein